MVTKELTKVDLEDVVRGACLLGSGGGGTYVSGLSLVNHFVSGEYYGRSEPKVACVDVNDVPESKTDCALVVAYMGAPEAIQDLEYPRAAVAAAEHIRNILAAQQKQLAYIVPVEVGALNSVVACTVAAKLGIPLIDGDGAGRAVPKLTMLTFSDTVPASPVVLASDQRLVLTLDIQGTTQASDFVEAVTRPVLSQAEFAQKAGLALWTMTVDELRRAVTIRGTLTAARAVGAQVKQFQSGQPMNTRLLMAAISEALGTKVFELAHGTLSSSESTTSGGFDCGQTIIKTAQGQCTIILQNESLIAWSDGQAQPLAMAPDSIACILHDRQMVYSNGDLVDPKTNKLKTELVGCKVTVLGIAANPALREVHRTNAEREDSTGLLGGNALTRAFQTTLQQLGYYGKYVPVEER
jgi:DUF917 family protein